MLKLLQIKNHFVKNYILVLLNFRGGNRYDFLKISEGLAGVKVLTGRSEGIVFRQGEKNNLFLMGRGVRGF